MNAPVNTAPFVPGTPANHPLDTRLPALLRSGRRLRGIFNALPSPGLVEMCGYAGFEFVIIDNEHGSAGTDTTEHMLRAARASGIIPVVRSFARDIARTLDMGASAVQVPMVNTAQQARELVDQVRYPPVGRRGCAFSPRAAGYGAYPGDAQIERANEGIALIVMLETPEAVANAAEIAAVPGVDAVFVGPNDLANAMGFGSRWKEPAVLAAIRDALGAVARAGKCPGIIALSPEDEELFAAQGARFFANVTTSVITAALAKAAQGAGGAPLAYG